MGRLNEEGNQIGATESCTNNIRVTIYDLCLWRHLGLGTIYYSRLITAPISLGARALAYRAGFGNDLRDLHGVAWRDRIDLYFHRRRRRTC